MSAAFTGMFVRVTESPQTDTYVWDTNTLTWVPLVGSSGVGTNVTVQNSSLAVTGAFYQATQPVSGPLTDTQLRASAVPISAATLPLPVTASTSAKQDTGNTSVASIDAKTPALGQATSTGSVPVVLTAAQLATLTPPAALIGFATETTLGTRLSESDFDTKIGSLTETAPTTDTASSGLNGRLQRIAQRVSTLITSLGSPFQAGGLIGNTAFQANAGTNLNTSALALDATLTNKTAYAKLTDGTTDATIKPASTLPAATDSALVITLRDSISSDTLLATLQAQTNVLTQLLIETRLMRQALQDWTGTMPRFDPTATSGYTFQ